MRRLLIASLALTAAGSQAWAQAIVTDAEEIPGAGPRLTATVTQSFVADSNLDLDDPRPGESYYADTRLLLGFLNETPVQTFALDIDTGLRALWQAEEDFDVTYASPTTARVGYGREWASGSGDGFLRYRRRDVDQSTLIDLDLDSDDPDDLSEESSDATEMRYDGGLGLEFATDSPSSYALNFAGTRFDYSGDTDGNRTPRTTLQGDAAWRLQFTPVLAGALGVNYSWYDADNGAETEIRQGDVDVGLIYDPSEVLQVSFGVGYGEYTRKEIVDGVRETLDDENGYVLRGGLRYFFEDVTVLANVRLTDAAPQTRLSGDVRAIYPLPRGEVRGQIFQRYGGGDTGNEIRVTGAVIGLSHEINTVSQLGLDFTAARQENFDTGEADIERFSVSAVYSRDITAVVSANIGYRYRTRDQNPESAVSNSVFFEIGRTFETGPY